MCKLNTLATLAAILRTAILRKTALAALAGLLTAAGPGGEAAWAASHIDLSGYYRINYMVGVNRRLAGGDAAFTDSYFDDRLLINLIFRPTDQIAVHTQLRGPNRERWGANRETNLRTQHIYGEIKQDWGDWLVGRLDDDLDIYGLASLGYEPGFGPYVRTGPFDGSDNIDMIRYARRWGNGLGLMAQYAKIDSGGWEDNGDDLSSDRNSDRFQAELSYQGDSGGALLGLRYDRDAVGNGYHGVGKNYRHPYYGPGQPDRTRAFFLNPALSQSWGDFSLHFEGMAGWGSTVFVPPDGGPGASFSRKSKGWGAYLDLNYNYGPGQVTLAGWWVSGSALDDQDSRSLVDLVSGNFYPLLVAYGGVGNGRFRTDGRRNGNATGLANNFFEQRLNKALPALTGIPNGPAAPFLNRPDMPMGRYDAQGHYADNWGLRGGGALGGNQGRFRSDSFNQGTDANHWALSLDGRQSFGRDVTLHYALAYLALNEPNYRVVDSASYYHSLGAFFGNAADSGRFVMREQPKDLGFEADLSLRFQLLDNLSFTTSFGYLFAGDAFRQLRGYELYRHPANEAMPDFYSPGVGDSLKAVWQEADDSYVWYNTLQINF